MTSRNTCEHDGCRSCHPGPLGDWSLLDREYLQALNGIAREQHFAAGEWVFRMGQPSGGLYCVAAGIVGSRMLHANGAGVILDIAYPGNLIGTPAFLRNGNHHTSAEALTEVRLCWLPGIELRRLIAQFPSLHAQLVRVCLDALDASREAMLQAAALSNHDRLMELLGRLLGHAGSSEANGQVQARLPISREDLAGMLGVRQETLSRLLKRLSDENLIEISGRHCRLLRPATRTGSCAQQAPRTLRRLGI
jgi:CRP-like cAMP-binding protein